MIGRVGTDAERMHLVRKPVNTGDQAGGTLFSGPRGRRFKSSRPDHLSSQILRKPNDRGPQLPAAFRYFLRLSRAGTDAERMRTPGGLSPPEAPPPPCRPRPGPRPGLRVVGPAAAPRRPSGCPWAAGRPPGRPPGRRRPGGVGAPQAAGLLGAPGCPGAPAGRRAAPQAAAQVARPKLHFRNADRAGSWNPIDCEARP